MSEMGLIPSTRKYLEDKIKRDEKAQRYVPHEEYAEAEDRQKKREAQEIIDAKLQKRKSRKYVVSRRVNNVVTFERIDTR
jgi:hypothetical protein